jgi:hypothetical protein
VFLGLNPGLPSSSSSSSSSYCFYMHKQNGAAAAWDMAKETV